MDLLNKIQLLFTEPTTFFKKTRKEDYLPAYKLTLCVHLVLGVFTVLINILSDHSTPPGPLAIASGISYIAIVIGALVQPWIGASLAHLGVLWFQGKDFLHSFKPVTYSLIIAAAYSIPLQLLALGVQSPHTAVPSLFGMILLFLVNLIHVVAFQVVGFKQYHKLTTLQSFASVFVIPLLLMALLIFLFLLPFMALFIAMMT